MCSQMADLSRYFPVKMWDVASWKDQKIQRKLPNVQPGSRMSRVGDRPQRLSQLVAVGQVNQDVIASKLQTSYTQGTTSSSLCCSWHSAWALVSKRPSIQMTVKTFPLASTLFIHFDWQLLASPTSPMSHGKKVLLPFMLSSEMKLETNDFVLPASQRLMVHFFTTWYFFIIIIIIIFLSF